MVSINAHIPWLTEESYWYCIKVAHEAVLHVRQGPKINTSNDYKFIDRRWLYYPHN